MWGHRGSPLWGLRDLRMLVQDLGSPCRLDLPSLPPGCCLGDRTASLGASPAFLGAVVMCTLAGQSAASALQCGQPGRLASQGKGETALGNGLLASQLAAWL